MPSASSRRSPWPWDMKISNQGVMLRDVEGSPLVGRKQQTLENVAPTTYEYSSQPVYKERTFPFRRLVLGMGERMQTSFASRRYRYALGVDCSIGGMPRPGPAFTSFTPASTGEIRDYVEALHGGTLTLFALAGQYVLRRASDTSWVVSHDFGAGRTVTMGVRFKAAGVGAIDALYVTLDNGDWWQYTGAAWVQGGGGTISGYALWVTGDELWIADSASSVRKATDDPMVAANFASAITVGDGSSSISWMAEASGQLFIFKTNGRTYSLNTDGTVNDLDPGVPIAPSANNGRAASKWGGRLWATLGDAFHYIVPGSNATFVPIGPERLLENDTEVRGRVQCSAGHQAYFLYEGVYNAQNGHSYLLKHGTWMAPTEQEDAAYDFAEVIHGALKKWTGKHITAMRVSGIGGTNERLYCGFSDGSIEFCALPKGTPDPVADYLAGGECTFTTDARELYWPLHHAMFQSEYKSFRGFSAFGPRLSSTDYVTQEYRTDSDGAYLTLASDFTSNGLRVDIEDGSGSAVGKLIECKTILVGIPVLEGMALHEQVRPILHLEYTFTPIAADYLSKRDGSVDRKTADQIRELVRGAAEAPGSVTLEMPDETTQGFSFIDYAEVLAPDGQRRGIAWDLPCKAVQFKTLTRYGIWSRLRPYTWGELRTMTWAQLRTL